MQYIIVTKAKLRLMLLKKKNCSMNIKNKNKLLALCSELGIPVLLIVGIQY